jgi:hypothetical protein
MALNFNKRAKGQSKREYAAQMLGGSKNDYNEDGSKKGSAKSSSSSSSKSSSKDTKAFEQALKDNGAWDSYQRLSEDQKEFTKFNYTTSKSDSKEKIKLLEASLKEATAQADPYWKSFLTVAQDEVARSYDDTKNTYEYQKTELETKIKNISADLAKNKDFYSLEQQSDLAKLKQSYEGQRDTVIEDAASKGLTFSTKKEVPLKQLADYNANVVESTNRGYTKKIEDLTTQTQQQIDESNRQLAQRAKDLGSNLTDIGRKAESTLGTENLPTLEGYNPLGNVSGDLYEKQVADIEQRKQAIYDEKAMTSLKF